MESLDMGFEPQTRARSNTWPLPRPENFVEVEGGGSAGVPGIVKCGVPPPLPAAAASAAAALKKNSSRRNAWGNLSYADLITQAIGSSPNKRLTLSQIYEWMVHNVAYFKDKGDSNSSAGWKNSIRHNLSLHNRFMRVQNEGTGKSSWWVLNPDAKPGKSARRRATSMETSKFEKRRGRVKKKVEALRSGLDATPSPSSSISESLDLFPDSPLLGFQLSPDFRPRASSNSSSGGRLSPIPSGAEGEWSTGAAGGGGGGGAGAGAGAPGGGPGAGAGAGGPGPQGGPPQGHQQGYYGPEQLAGSLEQTMRLGQEAGPPSTFAYPPPPPYRPAPAYTAPQPCPLNNRHLQPCHCTSTNPVTIKNIFGNLFYSVDIGGVQTEYQTSESPSPPTPMTMMGQLMGTLNPSMLDDLNINIETLPLHGTFECNVDEVIRHELSMDGTLDFNFGQQPGPQSSQEQPPFSGHSWVH